MVDEENEYDPLKQWLTKGGKTQILLPIGLSDNIYISKIE